MTPSDAKAYLESFFNFEIHLKKASSRSFRLDRVRYLLDFIGNPQERLKVIHIAGSKGKGSTSALTAEILHQAGYKIGLYTSPHLYDFKERIRIVGVSSNDKGDGVFKDAISSRELASYVAKIKSAVDQIEKSKKFGALTFFEVFTALALLYFAEKNVDAAVLETGLGGRLDATNAVDSIVCAITPVSLEHTKILGDTLQKIAREKAAIIKSPGQYVVFAPQVPQIHKILNERCKKFNIVPFWVDQYFQYQRLGRDSHGQKILLCSKKGCYKISLPLLGQHQVENVMTAIGIIECLKRLGYDIPDDAVQSGCRCVYWPGRFEVLKGKVPVILDGAHNGASIRALIQTVKDVFPRKKHILVLGISNDKNKCLIAHEFKNFAQDIFLTKASHPRAMEFTSEDKRSLFPRKNIIRTSNVKEAMIKAKQRAREGNVIVVTGSLFVISEARLICHNSRN